jgi:hypothetical protein
MEALASNLSGKYMTALQSHTKDLIRTTAFWLEHWASQDGSSSLNGLSLFVGAYALICLLSFSGIAIGCWYLRLLLGCILTLIWQKGILRTGDQQIFSQIALRPS